MDGFLAGEAGSVSEGRGPVVAALVAAFAAEGTGQIILGCGRDHARGLLGAARAGPAPPRSDSFLFMDAVGALKGRAASWRVVLAAI